MLLMKLGSSGITGKFHLWIRHWLKDRKQRVHINGQFWEWNEVKSQGPMLFNVLIHDLKKGTSSEVARFADDIELFTVVKTMVDCEEQ